MRPLRRLPTIRQGLALLLVGILITACGEAAVTDPPSDERSAQTDDPAEQADDEEEVAGEPVDGTAGTGILDVAIDGRELTVTRPDGTLVFAQTLPADTEAEFQTVFDAIAVRPGATATDLDAIVATTRGEVAILHHLRVRDGVDAQLVAIADHLQPQDVMESRIVLAWSPDADSVLWTEPTSQLPVLRTFGWDDGPGTGRPTDDNASFALDLPMDVSIGRFVVHDETTWTLVLIDGIGEPHEVAMERQADGALALPA